jgi:hypothetical protein
MVSENNGFDEDSEPEEERSLADMIGDILSPDEIENV